MSVGQNIQNGKIWAYNWNYKVISWGVCRPTSSYISGSLDIGTIVTGGKFNYLHDIQGQEITVRNIIKISSSWDLFIKPKYDIVILGFSLIDLLNSIIDLIVGFSKYILEYIVLITGNILDLISMFFYNYQDSVPSGVFQKNACYFGDVFPIKDTLTETGITHSPNNGLLDIVFYMLFSLVIYKIIRRKL